ncbi:hypothetical protein B9G55_02000 [Saccharibacillus sp. O16]|nr:hypothetical protein B9G55_02000 [Saccharibacillus sp. O16]
MLCMGRRRGRDDGFAFVPATAKSKAKTRTGYRAGLCFVHGVEAGGAKPASTPWQRAEACRATAAQVSRAFRRRYKVGSLRFLRVC